MPPNILANPSENRCNRRKVIEVLSTLSIRLMRILIRGYQVLISPIIGPRCRYLPTCSEYFLEAVQNHGVLTGAKMGLIRVARCHPWGSHGYDPVPVSAVKPADQEMPAVAPPGAKKK